MLSQNTADRTGPQGPGVSRVVQVLPGPDAVAFLLDETATFCRQAGFNAEQQAEVQLILEELVINAITHGRAPEMLPIEVTLAFDGTDLGLRIRGQGRPFDPTVPVTPDLDLPLEERAVGGLGMFLVQQLADEMRYHRADGMNQLDIRKRMRREGAA